MSIGGLLEKAIAGRWIAGESVDDATAAAERLNKRGVTAMINYLGEDLHKEEKVEDAVRTYRSLVLAASSKKIKVSIAVKPTQLGLLIGRETLSRNYSEVVAFARKHRIFVWLDMEEERHVAQTIELYGTEVRKGMVGICIQSYLKRSRKDVRDLLKSGAVIRLVKGAYRENAAIAYRTRAAATRNYYILMEYLFQNAKAFMIATHDEEIIEKALVLKQRHKAKVSFAMLNGVNNRLAFRLAEREEISIYLPFGGSWVSYGYRRLKELENSKLILRSLLEPQS